MGWGVDAPNYAQFGGESLADSLGKWAGISHNASAARLTNAEAALKEQSLADAVGMQNAVKGATTSEEAALRLNQAGYGVSAANVATKASKAHLDKIMGDKELFATEVNKMQQAAEAASALTRIADDLRQRGMPDQMIAQQLNPMYQQKKMELHAIGADVSHLPQDFQYDAISQQGQFALKNLDAMEMMFKQRELGAKIWKDEQDVATAQGNLAVNRGQLGATIARDKNNAANASARLMLDRQEAEARDQHAYTQEDILRGQLGETVRAHDLKASADQERLDFDAENAAHNLLFGKGSGTRQGSAKGPTEGQSKANFQASQTENALKLINGLYDPEGNLTDPEADFYSFGPSMKRTLGAKAPFGGNESLLLPEKATAHMNAWNDAADSLGRTASGTAIKDDEWLRMIQQAMPVRGDEQKPGVIKLKLQRLNALAQAQRDMSGPYADALKRQGLYEQEMTTKQTPTQGGRQLGRNPQTGEVVYKDASGKWVPLNN